jgi:predicted AAA+ superfamily ATPase
MYKKDVIEILEDWNFWNRSLETGIERSFYLSQLEKLLTTRQIIVVTGARRSGKSFLMRQLAKKLIENGVEKNSTLIVNFEDPRFTELNAKNLQEIYEIYLELLSPKKKPYIFLDEIQEVKNWEKFVRSLHELQKAHIIISGSNAKLLSKELSTLLTGRHVDITVFPLSFSEFLNFNNIYLKNRLDIAGKRIEIKKLLREYIEFGSYPEVVLSKLKKEILLNYYADVLNKDLIRRYKIRKNEKLETLARFYLTNISHSITFNSIEKFLGISADTVEKFSGYFEDVYLLFFLKRFSYGIKEQEKSPRKVYCIDTGLSNTIGFKFSQNVGKLAENIVLLELKRREARDLNFKVYYWKDVSNRETDFVIKEGTKVTKLIQVCWDITNFETKKREVIGLLKSMEEFQLKEGIIITEDYTAEETINNRKIKFLPLWEWLLNENSN